MAYDRTTQALEDEAAAILTKLDAPLAEKRGPYRYSGVKKTGFWFQGLAANEADPSRQRPAQPNRVVVRFEVLSLHRRHWNEDRIGAVVGAVRAQVAALGYPVEDWIIRQPDANVVQKHGFEIILEPNPALVAAHEACDLAQFFRQRAATRAQRATKILADVQRAVDDGDVDQAVLVEFRNWARRTSEEAAAKTQELAAVEATLCKVQDSLLKVAVSA